MGAYFDGTVLKTMHIPGSNGCVEIVARQDGTFQFYHRAPCQDDRLSAERFRSAVYISAETAEEAARLMLQF